MIRARLPIAPSRDDGLGLPEVMVTLLITTLVLTMVGGFFINIVNNVQTGRSTRSATGSVANALNEVGRVVRSGANNPIATGSSPAIAVGSTGTAMTVISYADTDPITPTPVQVSFSVDSTGALLEQRVAGASVGGYWTFTGATRTRTFSGPFATTTALFVYRDASGASVLPTTATLAASVRSVEITLTSIAKGRAGDDPVQATTTALMPNLGLN